MSIPPLLSSTPPPLEENESVLDNDDDFGDFGDYASVGAVSSTTSVTDGTGVFRSTGISELPCGPSLSDTDQKPDNLQEIDQWSDFDTSVIQPLPALEPTEDDSVEFGDQKSEADGSLSDSGENPPLCMSYAGSTDQPPTLSPSTSQVIISEQLNLGSVLSGSCSDMEVQSSDSTSQCECDEQNAGKVDNSFCENVNTLSVNTHCEVEEMKSSVEDDLSSGGDNHDLEFDNAGSYAVEENDSEDHNSLHVSSVVMVSDRNQQDGDDNNESVSDGDDFMDNFQSFSNDVETNQQCVSEEAQLSVSNVEDTSFVSCEEQETSTCVQTSQLDYSQPVASLSEAEFPSLMQEPTATEVPDEAVSIDQDLKSEQILASNEEADDDFDDFEEFVAAKDGPSELQPVVDATTYHWNAFENSASDVGDWAAFQDSDQILASNSTSEIVASSVTNTQQPLVTYSGRLSKESMSSSLYTCFRSSTQSETYRLIAPLHHTFDARHFTNSKPSKEVADGVEVWNGLRVMENTPALKYQWQQSHCNDLLLHAINIDARNILNPPRKSAAPAFATNLGLLEPKKAVPDPFSSLSADSTVPHGNLSFPVERVPQRLSDATGSGRQVEFSMHSDMLMEANECYYFVLHRLPIKKPEKELLEVLELPDTGATQSAKSRSSPLDSILKAITSTTTTNTSLTSTTMMKDGTTEPLSAEASAVLSRLPDLSFMHSKVLMFPVSDCAN